MKKLLLGSAAILSVATFQASQAQAQAQDTYSAGPYVGVYGGYGWTDAEVNGNASNIDPDGGDYGIYAGFQADTLLDNTVNRTGLGLTGALEAHYGWSDAEDNVGGVQFDKDHEWGVSFRPGLTFLNNTMGDINPYGIIGYRNTTYDASVGGFSGDESFDGFELGLGTELVAYDNIGIRADYTHVWYGEENGFDPDEDNVRLGIGYKF